MIYNMNTYFELIGLCTLGVALLGVSICIHKNPGCNIISYLALLSLAMYVNVMVINIYYSIQNYNVYLKNTKEFLLVLAGVSVADIILYLIIMKSLKLKTIKNYNAIIGFFLFVSLNIFNSYYLFKSLSS